MRKRVLIPILTCLGAIILSLYVHFYCDASITKLDARYYLIYGVAMTIFTVYAIFTPSTKKNFWED